MCIFLYYDIIIDVVTPIVMIIIILFTFKWEGKKDNKWEGKSEYSCLIRINMKQNWELLSLFYGWNQDDSEFNFRNFPFY